MTTGWWVHTAVLATHVQWSPRGFRQRDVRFMLELLSIWRWSADERNSHPRLHNTQILRGIKELHELGWLKKTQKKQQSYHLTRSGLVGILTEIRDVAMETDFMTFWFLSYILQGYKSKLMTLFEREGSILPLSQRMEMEQVLDKNRLFRDRRIRVEQRLNYWKRRIEENSKISAYVMSELKAKKPLDQVVRDIEKFHPYELNRAKPLSQFIAEIPEDLKVWEMTEGQVQRAKMIWQKYAQTLELEIKSLGTLP